MRLKKGTYMEKWRYKFVHYFGQLYAPAVLPEAKGSQLPLSVRPGGSQTQTQSEHREEDKILCFAGIRTTIPFIHKSSLVFVSD
jgi:hypothetical protein